MRRGTPKRILVGGVFNVLLIWDRHGRRTADWKSVLEWKSLPKWTYDPTCDTHRTTSLDKQANNPLDGSPNNDSVCSETSDSEGDDGDDDSLSSYEDFEDSDNNISYVWPSDKYRYEASAYSSPFKALSAIANQDQRSVLEDSAMTIICRTQRQITMGQHRVSTFRVLVRLMSEVHKDIFDGISVTFKEDFWANLWFNLDEKWGTVSPTRFTERVS
ncbi:MAG: hypothetical protein M1839_007608 [Geoglossum umbratile]|nr:MAG: hypothetical protein M1839_007608 [Geoglossum umbratile]